MTETVPKCKNCSAQDWVIEDIKIGPTDDDGNVHITEAKWVCGKCDNEYS